MRTSRPALAVAVLAALGLSVSAACGGGGSTTNADADPGGGDGGAAGDGGSADPDAAPPTSGLVLAYEGEPAFPATLGGPYEIALSRSVRLDLRDVRIIGDAAPGDARTSRAQIWLAWGCEEGDGGVEEGEGECEGSAPRRFSFPDAPEGIYSSLLARLHLFRYEGQATTDQRREFTVEEEPEGVDVTIPLPDVPLGPGEVVEIVIGVALDDPVLAVDWGAVAPDGSGILLVNEGSSQIDSVIAAAAAAFRFSGTR
jgi:hypothetical protein